MHKPTFRQKLNYRFDRLMSRGTPALLLGLFAANTATIVLITLVVAVTRCAPGKNFPQLLWMGLMRTMDPGNVGGDTGEPFFILMMLAATVAGMFVFAALVGVLNKGLEGHLAELRKGRSVVLEHDHTVILGWSTQVFTIIKELVTANLNRKRGATIVILADQDKVMMQDAIRKNVPTLKNTKVICRSGSPVNLIDLEIVSLHAARSIIILAEGSDPDTHVIKTVLAITNPARGEEPYHVHVVAKLADSKNLDVVKNMVGAKPTDKVIPICGADVIARVAAQSTRQSGLSLVYTELIGFAGNEIYFQEEPRLQGKTFGETLSAYENCTVIGLRRENGKIEINPPMDSKVEKGDKIIALAEDDDKVVHRNDDPPPQPEKSLIRECRLVAPPRKPVRTLILGWNPEGAIVIQELDNYVPPGSQVTAVSDIEGVEEQIGRAAKTLKNQVVTVHKGDIRDRHFIENLGAKDYDHVIVLAYSHLGPQEADAITLVTLLLLRFIADRDEATFSIVSEMLDLRNRELAKSTNVDDFIASEQLIGMMMVQVSENAELWEVFSELFKAEGNEIYFKPMDDYVECETAVHLYTVTEAAKRRDEVTLGYRVMKEKNDEGKSYGVHINPSKSAKVTFDPGDKIIVMARPNLDWCEPDVIDLEKSRDS